MSLSCASLAARVQAQCGRTGDTVLITGEQVALWFNEAQGDIVERVPGLHAMTFKNTTSHDTTQTLRYALADITGGDYTTQGIAHVWNVSYLDGANSRQLDFVHTDEFDSQWPDPTNTNAPLGQPSHWTRRGQYLELRPVSSCAYCDKDLRFDGDFYARDFTTDSTVASDLSRADEGLVSYALAQAWRAIGSAGGGQAAILRAIDYSQRYEMWLDNYERRNNSLVEWDGNMFSDNIV